MFDPPTIELIRKHAPAVKEDADIPLWLAKAPEPLLLRLCLQHHVMKHVVDWKKFIKSLTVLKGNPYVKDDKGEDPTQYIHVRDQIVSILPEPDKAKIAPTLETRRYVFAAWSLWNQPANKSRMYMPVATIVQYCNRQSLDIDEFYKNVRKHPDGIKGVILSADLADAEGQIQKFLETAQASTIMPPTYKELDGVQNNTIRSMLASRFGALQGGAGVGKTTTVGRLIDSIAKAPDAPTVFCLAFTHKAKRCIMDKLTDMGIAINDDVRVSTIHSFIATYNRPETPIPRCYILIDESSMIDIELLANLADVVSGKCPFYQLGFVGDMMQLPPITRGEFFRHLVATKGAHVNELHKCYRTDKPDLFDAYQAIRQGKLPKSTENFKVITVDNDKDINSQVGKLIYSNQATLQTTTQFIAWQNKDVYKINQWVQAALLKQQKIGPASYKTFYKGDKVIYRGDNTKTLTNAMTGRVTDVSARNMSVLWEDGLTTPVTNEIVKSINLAYALTVHCLQGSECDNVIIACYEVEKMKYCLDRRFLYTGVSRGKQHVTVITTPNIDSFLQEPIKKAPLTGIRVPV